MTAKQNCIVSGEQFVSLLLSLRLFNACVQAPFYAAMTEVIKVGCRGAIWVAEKI